jgi:nicotinate-nucleotide pyrophosphorylase (carboxylating)
VTFDLTHPEVQDAVRRALDEDIGAGDITSQFTIPSERMANGRFVAREPMIVAGSELLFLIYQMRGGVEYLGVDKTSGSPAEPDDCIAIVRGHARTLLECERVALNFMQRLSGVATMASRYAKAVAGTRCKVLDTRKTTPGLRRLEKMAAAAGGVANHRLGLFDAILIKNNHIVAAGGVTAVLDRASESGLPVEIEIRTRAELDEALAAGAKRLLLDNLSPAEAAEWIRYIDGRAKVELSGGITLDTVRAYAEAGADFVSSGAITHSAPAVDINFRLEWQ